MGRIAAYYYLQYTTAALFSSNLQADMDLEQLAGVLCAAAEYDELPVRHNEDKLNAELANQVGGFLPLITLSSGDVAQHAASRSCGHLHVPGARH